MDSDEVYLGELNPRISGASSMTNVTAGAYADIPLFLFHLLEYMDVDYELDVDEINERWAKTAADDVWSQLIMKETSPTSSGSTRRRARAVAPRRPRPAPLPSRSLDWHQLQDESEVLLPARLRSRRLPVQGRRPRHPGDQGPPAIQSTQGGNDVDHSRPSSHRLGPRAVRRHAAGEPAASDR